MPFAENNNQHSITGRCLIDAQLQSAELIIVNGFIQDIVTIPENDNLAIISPGFIDLQVNGAADRLLNASPDSESILAINCALQQFGTTAWLPTVVTDTIKTMETLADAVAELRVEHPGILGVHFEGPHINRHKKGVHAAEYIRAPASAELQLYNREEIGTRLLTVAPETLTTDQFKQLKESGAFLSVGHSDADSETMTTAINQGLGLATHLFNAMSGPTSRAPGVVGAVLASELAYGLILDGEHVHPTMAKAAYRANPNMILVTDAMPLLASERNEFDWFGQEIQRHGQRLTDTQGRLAGACISQLDALQNALRWLALSIPEALHLVTRNPAKALGVFPEFGCIQVGSRADLVALTDDLALKQVWVAGKPLNS